MAHETETLAGYVAELKFEEPGDMVWIEESKPISKLKRWTVVRGEQKKTA